MDKKGVGKANLRSPMSPHVVGKGSTPPVADNTTVSSPSPRHPAPLNSPMEGHGVKKPPV